MARAAQIADDACNTTGLVSAKGVSILYMLAWYSQTDGMVCYSLTLGLCICCIWYAQIQD